MTPQNSPNLSLPYIQPAQAQKHVTHNEALRILDIVVQGTAVDGPRADPPQDARTGARYLVAPDATGDWTGQDGAIAVREDGAWSFVAGATGWQMRVIGPVSGTGTTFVHDGARWQAEEVRADVQAVGKLGVNATADETNRLSVSAHGTLLDHAGADHRLTLNRATQADTASVLFQTGYAGRAEIGTTGGEGFAVKVSADGTTWRPSITVDPDDGTVAFPAGAKVPQRIGIGGRWYCYPDNRWITFDLSYGTASENHDRGAGTGAEPETFWAHLGPFLSAGTEIRGLAGTFRRNDDRIVGADIRVYFQHGAGQHGAGTSGWHGDDATTRLPVLARDGLAIPDDGWVRCDARPGTPFVAPQDGHVLVFVRPVGALDGLRVLYSSLVLDILSPG